MKFSCVAISHLSFPFGSFPYRHCFSLTVVLSTKNANENRTNDKKNCVTKNRIELFTFWVNPQMSFQIRPELAKNENFNKDQNPINVNVHGNLHLRFPFFPRNWFIPGLPLKSLPQLSCTGR